MQPKRYNFFKGRVALHALLQAAGIEKGEKVLLPGYTCIVVPNAVIFHGGKPEYLDIDSKTYNLDPKNLEKTLNSSPPGSYRILIVQHTYGIPCDMDPIIRVAASHGLWVIEDSCHALGSTYRGQPVGSLGDAAFFSSQWSKPVTTGLGGWAIVNNDKLVNPMEAIQSEYPDPGKLETLLLEVQYLAYRVLYHPRLFWSIQSTYRKLGDLGLAIGSSTTGELACEMPLSYTKAMGKRQRKMLDLLLDNIERNTLIRRKHTRHIEDQLKKAGFPTVETPAHVDPVFLRYPVPVMNKEDLLQKARSEKIQLGDWFLSPVHPNLDRWEMVGYQRGQCPNAEEASRITVNISTDSKTSPREIEKTIQFLKEYSEPFSPGKTMKSGGF